MHRFRFAGSGLAATLALLVAGAAAPTSATALGFIEDFEDAVTGFSIVGSGASFVLPSADVSHSGLASLRINPSGCAASCGNGNRVDLVYTFPETTFVGSIELWALEASTTGTGWGGKMRVGHDGAWDLDWWGIIDNGNPVTGEWQFMSVPINDSVDSITIQVWDVTSRSTVWLDDVNVVVPEPGTANLLSLGLVGLAVSRRRCIRRPRSRT